MTFSPKNSSMCPTLHSGAYLFLSPLLLPFQPGCAALVTERELVSHLIYASMFLPAPSLIIGEKKSTLSPGWLVPAHTDITSPAGFEVPEDLGHFFGVELHFNQSWELGLPLWGALYPSGNASCPVNNPSAL